MRNQPMTLRAPLKTPGEILQIALQKETQAHDFYTELGASCSVPFVKELFNKLENEEAKHMRLIQDMIKKLESGKSLA
jgi:rubrerythrin